MESDPSQGTRASETGLLDSLRDFVAFFVHYVELRLQLLGLESRETGFHLLFLALLFVSTVICFGGFVIMVVVFLLYLMMLTLHWEWGWSALALAGMLLVISIGMAMIFKFRIAKPFFPATIAEFQKDREWLKHTTKSSR
jgi:uncharacterized membrane protein YqjE